MLSMASKESHSWGYLILDSIFSGPRCFNCNQTFRSFSLAASSGKGASPRSARWPTQALLCLPWGAQHTVSVTKMRLLEMLKRQWGCMAPALGSAWGLEPHTPVARIPQPRVLLRKFWTDAPRLSARMTMWMKFSPFHNESLQREHLWRLLWNYIRKRTVFVGQHLPFQLKLSLWDHTGFPAVRESQLKLSWCWCN